MICPKVRLADVINCSGEDWKQGFGGRISQKHLDFVIADAASTAIVLAIELDDRSHRRADRQQRDTFVDRALAAAGIPMVRVPATATYDARALSAVLARKLDAASPATVTPD
jgi:very-short-patch-repair endonuclease